MKITWFKRVKSLSTKNLGSRLLKQLIYYSKGSNSVFKLNWIKTQLVFDSYEALFKFYV